MGVSSDGVERGGLDATEKAIPLRRGNKAVAGPHPNAFQLKGDATKGGEGSELGSPGYGVCIYHDASPGVWRLLTAPGHVSRGERGKDRRREDVEAGLRWGMGCGGCGWGCPAPQPAGGKAATSAEPHSRGGAGAAVEQRLMHLSALQGASLATRCPSLCRLRTPRGCRAGLRPIL